MKELLPELVERHQRRSRIDQNEPIKLRGELAAYFQVFKYFFRSNAVASSMAERKLVKDQYCDALSSMYQDLSSQERHFSSQLKETGDDIMGFARTPAFIYDFETYVAPVCKA